MKRASEKDGSTFVEKLLWERSIDKQILWEKGYNNQKKSKEIRYINKAAQTTKEEYIGWWLIMLMPSCMLVYIVLGKDINSLSDLIIPSIISLFLSLAISNKKEEEKRNELGYKELIESKSEEENYSYDGRHKALTQSDKNIFQEEINLHSKETSYTQSQFIERAGAIKSNHFEHPKYGNDNHPIKTLVTPSIIQNFNFRGELIISQCNFVLTKIRITIKDNELEISHTKDIDILGQKNSKAVFWSYIEGLSDSFSWNIVSITGYRITTASTSSN